MKSLLLTGEMVRAILDGRKTKTRRPLTPQPEDPPEGWYPDAYNHSDRWCFWGPRGTKDSGRCTLPLFKCPFGQVGGQIYVRETFCLEHQVEKDQPPPFGDSRPIRWEFAGMESDPEGADSMWLQPHYRATDPTPELAYEDSDGEPTVRWKSSIHMPRWASRITLEITDIRVERLQEITEKEAKAEGFFAHDGMTAVYWFSEAWDSLYAKKGLGWNDNPWVWVLTFRRVEG